MGTTRDVAIRSAERQAYGHYNAAPYERWIDLYSGCGRVEVRVTEFGDDSSRPPIVMLHGITSVNVLAAPILPYLRDRRVVAVDWPGHGLSGPCILPLEVGIRTHAVSTISSLLNHFSFDEADLVGHSLGAQFSLYAAHDLGTRIRRIALLGAPGAAFVGVKPLPMMKPLAVPLLGRRLLSMPMPKRAYRHNQDLVYGVDALNSVPPALAEALHLFAERRSNAASLASYFRLLIRRGSIRPGVAMALDELGRIRQPTLMAWGDQDVFQTPNAAAGSIAALRDLRFLRLTSAGHVPWLQAQVTVGAAIAAHLST